MSSTFHELNDCLIRLNRAVIKQDKTLEIDSIDDQIAYHQAHRNRLAGSSYYGKMDHSFKNDGKWSNGKVCTKPHENYDPKKSDEYDDHYYSIVNLRCKKKILMDTQV